MNFDRSYFESDNQNRGYRYEGYRNYAFHYKTAEIIYNYCKKHNCSKLLELGSARGYTAKILESKGLDVIGIDISQHCYHTRVIKKFILYDITDIPYPFNDQQFDLVYSIAVLEHLPVDKIGKIIEEIARISRCTLHGISTTSWDIDDTHQTIKPIEWWQKKFEEYTPIGYSYHLLDKKELETPPYPIPGGDGLRKINLGSYINMFYYQWENIDILDLKKFAELNHYNFKQLDIREPLPYDENTIDLIFTSHTLEHLTDREALQLLEECNRILKPGGLIRIAVPDSRKLAEEYIYGTIKQYSCINKGVEQSQTDIDALNHLLWSGHKTIYDEVKLKKYLEQTNFYDISRTTPFHSRNPVMEKQTFISHPSVSLIIEAVK